MCLTIDQWTFNKTIQLLRRPALVGVASCLELRRCFLFVLEKNTSEIRFADSARFKMSSAKKCRNLAEEDRRQKALKKEKKAVKKWKWTSDFDQESFKREDAAPLQEESFTKENASLNCGSESSSNKVDEVTSKLVCLALESKSNPALAQRQALC